MRAALAVLLTVVLSAAQQDSARPLTLVGRGRVSAIYDVRADGRYLYALERGVLHVLDPLNPAALREVGSLEFKRPRARMALRPPYLYLSGFNEPLGIIDISQPSQPRFVADLPRLGSVANDGFELAEGIAYLIRRERQPDNVSSLHLDVLDVATNPRQPTRLGSVDLGLFPPSDYGGIAHADGKAFLVATRRPGVPARSSLLVIDPRNPAQPRIERTLFLPEGKLYRDLEVRGNLVYMLQNESRTGGAGLAIYRLPESGELELLGEAITPDLRIPIDLIVRGDVVYATFKSGGLLGTFDVTDPRAPTLTNVYRQTDSWAAGLGMQLAGNRLYVSGDNGPSPILDVSQPRSPVLVGRYEFEGGSVSTVQVEGNLAVLSSLTNVHLFDVSNPRTPRRAGFYAAIPSHNPEEFEFGMVVAAAGRRAIVGFEKRPTQVIDFSSTDHPKLLATFTPRGAVRAALLDAKYAALGYEDRQAGDTGGVEFIDVSDAAKPRSMAFIDLGKPVRTLARTLNRMVAAHPDGGLSILDVTDPNKPVVQGRVDGNTATPLDSAYVTLSSDGGIAYLARPDTANRATLLIIDLKEPATPRVLAQLVFPISGSFQTPLAVQGSRVMILAGGNGGVVTVDARNPQRPGIISVRALPVGVYAEGLALDALHLYVAGAEDGVLVFQQPAAGR